MHQSSQALIANSVNVRFIYSVTPIITLNWPSVCIQLPKPFLMFRLVDPFLYAGWIFSLITSIGTDCLAEWNLHLLRRVLFKSLSPAPQTKRCFQLSLKKSMESWLVWAIGIFYSPLMYEVIIHKWIITDKSWLSWSYSRISAWV